MKDKTKFFLIFIIFFAVGVFAGSFLSLSIYFGLFFIFLGIIFLVLRSFSEVGLLFSIALVFLAFGAGFFWMEYRTISPDLSEFQVGQEIKTQAVVIDEPDERENYTKLIVQHETSLKILIYTNRFPEFNYGDRVKIEGLLKRPEDFDDDFSWVDYLAKDDIFLEMFYPKTILISHNNASWIKQKLFSLKHGFLENISEVIPEPHSALLGGLTFGAKRSMSPDLLEDFRKTGIIHIVVLSGYNVTIVADAIMRVFSFFPSALGISLGVLGIISFAVMSGASATIVRASLMAILVLLARATGRIYEITIALFTAGFLMILHNPKILRFDSSFQLSFLATMALIYLAPLLEPYLKFLPKKFKIREFTTATIATQIFVLPLLLYKMGLFSVVSVPVNLLILIFIPATMFFGFLTALVSIPFGWIAYALLTYELKVVDLFSSLPFASFTISNFPLWLMWMIYAGYAILIFYGFRQKKF